MADPSRSCEGARRDSAALAGLDLLGALPFANHGGSLTTNDLPAATPSSYPALPQYFVGGGHPGNTMVNFPGAPLPHMPTGLPHYLPTFPLGSASVAANAGAGPASSDPAAGPVASPTPITYGFTTAPSGAQATSGGQGRQAALGTLSEGGALTSLKAAGRACFDQRPAASRDPSPVPEAAAAAARNSLPEGIPRATPTRRAVAKVPVSPSPSRPGPRPRYGRRRSTKAAAKTSSAAALSSLFSAPGAPLRVSASAQPSRTAQPVLPWQVAAASQSATTAGADGVTPLTGSLQNASAAKSRVAAEIDAYASVPTVRTVAPVVMAPPRLPTVAASAADGGASSDTSAGTAVSREELEALGATVCNLSQQANGINKVLETHGHSIEKLAVAINDLKIFAPVPAKGPRIHDATDDSEDSEEPPAAKRRKIHNAAVSLPSISGRPVTLAGRTPACVAATKTAEADAIATAERRARGCRDMVAIRAALRIRINKRLATSTSTRYIFFPADERLDEYVMAVVEHLGVDSELAEEFLLQEIDRPKRGGKRKETGEEPPIRAGKPLGQLWHHMLGAIKDRAVEKWLQSLNRTNKDFSRVDAGTWLTDDVFTDSALGTAAMVEVVKDMQIFVGAGQRVFTSPSGGEGVKAVIGTYALGSVLVREFLVKRRDGNVSAMTGPSGTRYSCWQSEVAVVATSFRRTTRSTTGCR